MLLVDTSGSMGYSIDSNRSVDGDNTTHYPGNGLVSRISEAKRAIYQLIDLSPGRRFGLARFPQIEGYQINDGTGRAHYTSLPLRERPTHYVGHCEPSVAESVLVEPGAPNGAVFPWLNSDEDYPYDKELRPEGPSALANTLRLLAEYQRDTNDDWNLVVFSDGQDSCSGAYSVKLAVKRLFDQGIRVFFVVPYEGLSIEEYDSLELLAHLGGSNRIYSFNEMDLLAGMLDAQEQEVYEALPVAGCQATPGAQPSFPGAWQLVGLFIFLGILVVFVRWFSSEG